MSALLSALHGSVAVLGIGGIAALWAVKAGIGWFLLRRWRARRPR